MSARSARLAPVVVGILIAAALAAAFLIGRASGADEPASTTNAQVAKPLERGKAALRTPGLRRAPALPDLRRERTRRKSKPAAPKSSAPSNGGNAPAPESTAPPSSPPANPPPKDNGGNSGGNDGGSEGRTIIH